MKILLYPFAIFYNLITAIRNLFYSVGIFKENIFENLHVVSVGNLSTGGTGKSPMICHLVEILNTEQNKIAILSRGYGRRTRGFLNAKYGSNAEDIGDEPMMFFRRFKNRVTVSVCEDRVVGIQKIMSTFKPNIVLLDDAYQHRAVKPSCNILLCNYYKPFYKDFVLPFGNLRESKAGYKRADIIVVTNCLEQIKQEEKEEIVKKIKPKAHQKVFFSYTRYSDVFTSKIDEIPADRLRNKNALLVTGIANSVLLANKIRHTAKSFIHLEFKDHHRFSEKDIDKILDAFASLPDEKIILTTEKDFVRLMDYETLTEHLYFWQIFSEVENQDQFIEEIRKNSKKNNQND